MLWLCIHLPELPLESLAPAPELVAGVVETRGNRRRLIRVSEAARQRGLHPGIAVPSALALAPEVRLLDRHPDAEHQVLEAVACWAYRFGAPVTYSSELSSVWVEIRHSLQLFGGWRGFRIEAERDARSLCYTCRYGIAPTLAAAALFAHSGAGFDRPIGRRRDLPLALRDKPLSLLPFAEQTVDVLYGSGLRTIGQVLALPRDSLSRRFGTAVAQWLDQLLGETPEAWDAFEPPVQYRRRFELAGAVTNSEALLFPLRAMISDFSLYLRARDIAVQQFRIVFVDGARERVPLDIGLLAPTRDPVRLMLVLRERLEKLKLSEGACEILLEADRFEAASVVQDDLFDSGRRSEDFDTLQERLVARLGPEAVQRLALTADHRPEKSWTADRTGVAGDHPQRPLWLLPEPTPISSPRLLGPAERIECGWWEGVHERRDYFLAEDGRGRRLWVFREPEADRWWLHGLWQ